MLCPGRDSQYLQYLIDVIFGWQINFVKQFNVTKELFDGIVLNQVYVILALAYSADNIDLCAPNLFFLPTVKFSPHSAGYLLGRSCLLLMLNNGLTHLVAEEHQCDGE